MDNDYFIGTDDETINLNILDTNDTTLLEKEKKEQEDLVLKSLRKDYVSFLREYYQADEKLFDMVDDLLEESDEQDKLITILNSL